MNLFGKYFKLTFIFIVFVLILSFLSYFYPLFNKIAFFTVFLLTLVLSLKKLEYGLYILLAELFIGSKGYLFHLDLGGVSISLRIALFLIVMSVWVTKTVIARSRATSFANDSGRATKQSRPSENSGIATPRLVGARNDFRWWWVLFAFIVWGFVWGLLRGNDFQNVFFDFNAWIYFGLIFVIVSIIKTQEQIQNTLQILTAGVLAIVLKTFFLLYIFSHQIEVAMRPLYRWLRTFFIGEITLMDSGFYRIFLQSQIYVLIGLFILIGLLVWQSQKKDKPQNKKEVIGYWLLVIGSLSSILISFSRSFWVGLIFGVLTLAVALIILKTPFKQFLKFSLYGLITIIVSLAAIWITFKFPYPTPSGVSLASMFEERLTDISEAAVRSRWDLLPPLGRAITHHPIVGSGFGTTVTYQSSDPRAFEINPTGQFTTYAFEWGYLDIWLKIGLAGLVIYLILIGGIWRRGQSLIHSLKFTVHSFLVLGMLLGLTALLITNFFSPYLNHPLGIGYIMLCSVIFWRLSCENDIFPTSKLPKKGMASASSAKKSRGEPARVGRDS